MLLIDLIPEYKRFALNERGITIKSFRRVKYLIIRLSNYAETPEINTVTTAIIREFLYDQKQKRDWKAKSFRNNRQSISSFFTWAVSMGYISQNPVNTISKPKVPCSLPRFLTSEQLETIIKEMTAHPWSSPLLAIRNRAIFMMFLYTGLRLSELLNLRLVDVDFQAKQLTVRSGKGDKDRIVPIHNSLIVVLKGYLRSRGKTLPPSVWFFSGIQSCSRLHPKNIYLLFASIKARCGVKFSPHMLRHTFARNCVESGMNIYTVQRILGHAHLSTTQVYLSISTKAMQQSINELNLSRMP